MTSVAELRKHGRELLTRAAGLGVEAMRQCR